ncbi:MAG: ATPase [Gammaproteobacteria bacterium RIFCSPHIGHO2_12_FULL_41_15]|nr:MAG: ATPase [Gammaproteobacteria bacterium RIFCSPHIGHO2_12_FULL_41_15]
MYKRLLSLPLASRDSFFLFGPRGTGKTTWLKNNLHKGEYIYIDLLEGLTFRTLSAHPESLSEQIPPDFDGRIVIDEVQKVPELLDEVHRLIEGKNYRFILTGSSARKLKRQGVNLLAGRAIRYTMHPLTAQELGDVFQLAHAIQFGMLPATYTYDDPAGYLATYVETYLREEVMQEGLTRNISAFARFLEIASFSQGSTINASEIAREVGIERQVIQNYFSILADLLLAHWLPAFTKRAKRRLITSEKFYYFDVGVYQHLRPKGLLDTPSEIAGISLETLFYQSALALIAYHKLNYQLYYWRTVNGVEVDFILYGEHALLAFEIKHNKTIHSKMLTGLKHFKQDYPMAQCYILYMGTQRLYLSDNIIAIPFTEALVNLPDLLGMVDSG